VWLGEEVKDAHLLIHVSEMHDHTIRKTEAQKYEGGQKGGAHKLTEKLAERENKAWEA
jgi:hypothetical protein